MSFYRHAQTPIASWRLAVLMGANTRTYKFALAEALLEVSKTGADEVELYELASQYAAAMLRRSADAKQAPGNRELGTKDFLRVLEEERQTSLNMGIPTDRLISAAVESMPGMVMTKFHNLSGGMTVQNDFYRLQSVRGNKQVILLPSLTDVLRADSAKTLMPELDSRWSLVETAWDANIGRGLMGRGPVLDATGELLLDPIRRANVAGSRQALVGFQNGNCFYCRASIPEDFSETHVDHVFPYALMSRGVIVGLDLNAVWNLVVSCANCNLSKSDRLPYAIEVERLMARNESIVGSPYPLKKAIESLTGKSPSSRESFFRSVQAQL